MPIILPPNQPPYPTAEYVLILARAICLDAGISAAGDLLADAGNYTFTLLQSAYEDVQDELANRGYETPKEEIVLANVTAMPSAVQDPSQRCYVGYDIYFDGENNNPQPVLPQDLLAPLVMGERPAGSGMSFMPMHPANNGLPLRQQYAYMGQWDWRGDRIYMVGAVQALDLWLRYQAYYTPLTTATSVVKIFHGGNALAYALSYAFAAPRAGEAAASFLGERDRFIAQIAKRTSQKTQHKNTRRAPYGGCRGGPNS
jgi:hypothetical protein